MLVVYENVYVLTRNMYEEMRLMNSKESKRERFVRLAEARTNKIIDMLKLLGNCSNSNIYEYTKDDVEKIFSAIDKAVKSSKQCFLSKSNDEDDKFRL